MMVSRRGLAVIVAAACLATAAGAAWAEDPIWPKRAVRLIAAQQAGSATDQVARILADFLVGLWKQPVVVDNRPGASGAIGTQIAARAEPDGHTLLVGGTSSLVTHPEIAPDVGFDAERDFVAIGRVAYVPFVLAVNAGVPAKSVAELVALARERPGRVSFATAGTGAFSAFALRAIAQASGAEFLSVEYKGSGTATLDLVAGRVDARVSELDAVLPHAAAGTVRILAVAGHRRSSRIPDVPTLAESGVPGVELTPWYGMLAPAGVAPEVRARLEAAYAAAIQDPTVRSRLESIGYDPARDAPGEFARAIRQDRLAARAIMRVAGSGAPPAR